MTGMLKNVQSNELNCPKEFFCTRKIGFDKPDEFFWKKTESFLHKIGQWLKKLSKNSPLLFFYGLVKCSFDKPAGKFLPEDRKLSAQGPKVTRKI